MHFCCLSHPVSSIFGGSSSKQIYLPLQSPKDNITGTGQAPKRHLGKVNQVRGRGLAPWKPLPQTRPVLGDWVSVSINELVSLWSSERLWSPARQPLLWFPWQLGWGWLGRTDSTVHSWQNEILVKLRGFLQSQRASTDQEGSLLHHPKPPTSTSPP